MSLVSVHLHKRVIPSRSRLLILSFWHLECFSPIERFGSQSLVGGRSGPISLFILAQTSVDGGRGSLIGWSLPPKPSDAEAHRVFACGSCVVPNLHAVLALARGHDVARASSNKVVVGGSVTAQTIHRPVGVGETRDGRDEIREVDHWMIPWGLK